ncbi:MAG: hypothetical protein ACOC0V_04030 [Oceanicaulis sp.]
MADHHDHVSMTHDAAGDLDGRVADALDRYADGGPPPGLSAMSARARRMDRLWKGAGGAAAAVTVFAAGWIADDLGDWRAEPVPREVADLMETEFAWESDLQHADFATLTGGALSPVPLTDLGLVLTRTETRRARAGSVQRMEYVTPGGRPVSVVMRRETPRAITEPTLSAYDGRDVVYWTQGPYSFGVTGDASREELVDIAETVRARLTLEQSAPSRPVADFGPALAIPATSSEPVAQRAEAVPGLPPGR